MMRKLLALVVLMLCIASGVWADLIDSYSESNISVYRALYSGDVILRSQSFTTSDNYTLDSCRFQLKVNGSPTGNMYAMIYSHTGEWGVSSEPGDSLCVSGAIDISTLTTSPQLITFIFSDANRISLSNGEYYCLVIEYSTGGDGSNYLNVSADNTSPTHDGNEAYSSGSSWTALSSSDICFYVYGSTADTCCSTSDSLAFGNCDTNTTATDSFFITACGDSSISGEIDWDNPYVAFIPLSDSAYDISGGDSTWFVIQFDPPDVATYRDTVALGHDSCGSIILSGTGTEPTEYPTGDNIHYMATGGDDGNSGNHPDTAWATLSYAMGQLSAGDTLYLMGGTYTGTSDAKQGGATIASGSSGNEIVIMGYPSQSATIAGYGTNYDYRFSIAHDYWVWRDLTIVDDKDVGIYGARGLNQLFYITGDYVSLINCDLYGMNPNLYNDSTYLENCVKALNADYLTIDSCSLMYCGVTRDAQETGDIVVLLDCDSVTISDNYFKWGAHSSILLKWETTFEETNDMCEYCQITDNTIDQYRAADSSWGGGIHMIGGGEDSALACYNLIEGNKIRSGDNYEGIKECIMVASWGNVIRGNYLYSPDYRGILIQAGAGGNIGYASGNMIYNNTLYNGGREGIVMICGPTLDPEEVLNDNYIVNNIIYQWRQDPSLTEQGLKARELRLVLWDAVDWWDDADNWGNNLFSNNLITHEADGDTVCWITYDNVTHSHEDVAYVLLGGGLADSLDNKFSGTFVNCIEGDPDFTITALSGMPLNSASPCKDAGISMADADTLSDSAGYDTLLWYGTAPDIGAYEITDTQDTCCYLYMGSIAFGNLQVLSTLDTSVVVSNCGDSTLYLDIGLADSTQYNLQSGGGLDTLTASELCTITVQFAPTSTGEKLDTLSFGHDSCGTVILTGEGRIRTTATGGIRKVIRWIQLWLGRM